MVMAPCGLCTTRVARAYAAVAAAAEARGDIYLLEMGAIRGTTVEPSQAAATLGERSQ